MFYFANPSTPDIQAEMLARHIGWIDTPAQGNPRPKQVVWCADNGCFGKGYPGDQVWFEWLRRNAGQAGRCQFATAPDVVGDAATTLERSLPWLPRIRALGYPAAYVAQDGSDHIPPPWDDLDVLFIGGSTAFKVGRAARHLVGEALGYGKQVHMGRVNSERRLQYAAAIGCHTADGTFLVYGPDKNLPQLLTWVRGLNSQTALRHPASSW